MAGDPVEFIEQLLERPLLDWQRRFVDEILNPANKGKRLELRYVGRKAGYAFVWVAP